jgi:hypothetical protein
MIDPRIITVAFLGLLTGAALVYSTGHDGSVAGMKIGPAKPWLLVAGR